MSQLSNITPQKQWLMYRNVSDTLISILVKPHLL